MAGQMIGGGLGGLGGLGIGDETGVAAAQLGMAHPAMQQAMQQGMQQGMQPHGMMQPGMQPQTAQWQVRTLSSCVSVPERVLLTWRARACSSLRSPRCTSTSRPGSSKRWRQRCALSPSTTLCTSNPHTCIRRSLKAKVTMKEGLAMMVEVNNLRGTGRRRGWLICLRLACLRLAVLAVLAVRRRDDVHGTF